MRFKSFLLPIALLLIATWLRTWQIDRVPPGLHYDETINAQIVRDRIFAGQPSIFYDLGGGREGLFFLTTAAAIKLWGFTPIGFRWASLAWNLIGLAVLFALARRLLGKRVAVIALAYAATSFWSLYQGREMLRVVSLVTLTGVAALAFFSAWQHRRTGRFILAGALLGLTIYTYHASRVLLAVFAMLIVYLAITRRREVLAARRGLALYALSVLIVAAPLFIFLQAQPATDVRLNDLMQPLNELRQGNFEPIANTALKTLGMFVLHGDDQWHYNVPATPVFDPITGGLFVLGVLIALRRGRNVAYAYYLIALIVGLIPGMLSEPAPHFIRTSGAQFAAYTLAAIGAAETIGGSERRRRRWGWLARALVIGAWVLAAIGTYRAYFVVWPINDEVRLYHQANVTDLAHTIDASASIAPVAACSPFLNEREDWLLSSRQTLQFVQQSATPVRWHDCRDSVVWPAGGAWREFILYFTPLDQNLPPETLSWFDAPPVPLNAAGDGVSFNVEANDRITTTLRNVDRAAVAWSPEAGGETTRLPIDFAHQVQLLGYQLANPIVHGGDTVSLQTIWQVTAQPPAFLTVFVHVLNERGEIVAQIDRQSVLADTLLPGDRFMQLHKIDLPPDLPPGSYRLSIGLYTALNGQRLPLFEHSTSRGDRVMLSTVTVTP
jgi:4-amino-4-deoxy-L-arabinose transferase-like glycosyltransferase